MDTFEYLVQELRDRNIRLSHQRLKILEYISNNRIHPTVDKIYSQLQKEIPTLSKTTVYNTLNTLAEAGLVKVLRIEENEARYDVDTKNHGHFKCEACGEVYDFHIDMDSLLCDGLEGFKVEEKDVYFKGLCPNCR
ncbi:MAG: transcriptional repressor [Tissierellia bacterium]|nr:transcriptional repressor [Tissierellia bacterium]